MSYDAEFDAAAQAFTQRQPIDVLTYAGVMDLPDPLYLVDDVFPQQGIAAIFGPSTAGKTFLAIDLALSVAAGLDWFGHGVREPVPVLYCPLEAGAGIKQRLRAWALEHAAVVGEDAFSAMARHFKMLNPKEAGRVNLRDLDSMDDLATAAQPFGAKLIIVDTLNGATPGMDENSGQDMSAALEGLRRLQALTEALVIIVHHTGKDEGRGMRGHSSLFAALDAVVSVQKSADGSRWVLQKSKDGESGGVHPFKLHVVSDGSQKPSCCVVPVQVNTAVSKVAKPKGKHQVTVWGLLQVLLPDAETIDGVKAVPAESLRSAVTPQLDVSPARRSQTFRESLEGLHRSGHIRTIQHGGKDYLCACP